MFAITTRGLARNNFICNMINAMHHCIAAGRSNVIDNLVYCIGTKRQGSAETRLSTSKMPFGLIEYNALFFSLIRDNRLLYFKMTLATHPNLMNFSDRYNHVPKFI